MAVIAAVGGIVGVLLSRQPGKPAEQARVAPRPARYDFEDGVMGWMSHGNPEKPGCYRVNSSADQHHGAGAHSLEMMLSVDGSRPKDNFGEAWVEVDASPLNLKANTITAWVYAPSGSQGLEDKPNGVQLFAKDSSLRSLYSVWQNVKPNRWLQLRLPIDSRDVGYIQSGFDPTKIATIGIKFGIGDGSAAKYSGSLYVDDVDW